MTTWTLKHTNQEAEKTSYIFETEDNISRLKQIEIQWGKPVSFIKVINKNDEVVVIHHTSLDPLTFFPDKLTATLISIDSYDHEPMAQSSKELFFKTLNLSLPKELQASNANNEQPKQEQKEEMIQISKKEYDAMKTEIEELKARIQKMEQSSLNGNSNAFNFKPANGGINNNAAPKPETKMIKWEYLHSVKDFDDIGVTHIFKTDSSKSCCKQLKIGIFPGENKDEKYFDVNLITKEGFDLTPLAKTYHNEKLSQSTHNSGVLTKSFKFNQAQIYLTQILNILEEFQQAPTDPKSILLIYLKCDFGIPDTLRAKLTNNQNNKNKSKPATNVVKNNQLLDWEFAGEEDFIPLTKKVGTTYIFKPKNLSPIIRSINIIKEDEKFHINIHLARLTFQDNDFKVFRKFCVENFNGIMSYRFSEKSTSLSTIPADSIEQKLSDLFTQLNPFEKISDASRQLILDKISSTLTNENDSKIGKPK